MIGLGPLACSPSTASISKLLFEHYVWVDPQTVFVSNPSDLLGALRHAPLHVPLEVEAAKVGPSAMLDGVPASRYGEIMRQCGVLNPVFTSRSAFWIVRREAIDVVCELATQGWHKARELGATVTGDFALGYAMQMLCGDPSKHTIAARPDLWAADYRGQLSPPPTVDEVWECLDGTGRQRIPVHPAIVHGPRAAKP